MPKTKSRKVDMQTKPKVVEASFLFNNDNDNDGQSWISEIMVMYKLQKHPVEEKTTLL